jgi:hypothetical protein
MTAKCLITFKITVNLDRKVLGVVMISKEIKNAPM